MKRLLRWPTAAPIAAASIVIACAPVAPARAPEPTVQATNLAPPAGTTLLDACTPTGPELCFNAIDDNCNGVIDEGCGLETGTLQFTIAWGANPADVNLALVTPSGERVPDEHGKTSVDGFHLDRDCPADDGCGGQNVENLYYDGADPPRGRYVVEVTVGEMHGAPAPVPVRFGARLGPRTLGFDVQLAPGEDARKTFSFELP